VQFRGLLEITPVVQSWPKDLPRVSTLMSPLWVRKYLLLEAELLVSFPFGGIHLQPSETALQTKPTCSEGRGSEDSLQNHAAACSQNVDVGTATCLKTSTCLKLYEVNPDQRI